MYNYKKAKELEHKADWFLHKHRRQVFNENEHIAQCHHRAIVRIGKLMGPFWRERNDALKSERMLRLWA